MAKKSQKITKQMTMAEFDALFPSTEACQQCLQARRWPDSVTCPRCNSAKVYALKTRPFHWICKNHETVYRFSLTVGTIFENSNVPLLRWFKTLFLMLTSKKGVSALQVRRSLKAITPKMAGSYKTAWYMCHRLRAGLADPEFIQLMGVVEVDETYVGGRDKNRHRKDRIGISGGSAKTTVVGAIARKGNVVCRVIERADTTTLDKFIRMAVDKSKVTLIVTDDHGGYRKLNEAGFNHETFAHGRGEYVRGLAHTNTMESFWSLLKRGVMGQYHSVSAKYLPLYLNEFAFRYNNRRNEDIFSAAVASY